MLNLMLANADNAFACGEVYAKYRPILPEHYDPICGCGDQDCAVWSRIGNPPAKGFYSTVFTKLPHIDLIVDSSKDISWYRDQLRFHRDSDVELTNIVIWKRPRDYAYSCWKRKRFDHWRRRWVQYHRQLLTILGTSFYSVAYQDLANNPGTMLSEIGNALGFHDNSDRQQYWRRTHHMLFGSAVARMHLFDQHSQ